MCYACTIVVQHLVHPLPHSASNELAVKHIPVARCKVGWESDLAAMFFEPQVQAGGHHPSPLEVFMSSVSTRLDECVIIPNSKHAMPHQLPCTEVLLPPM